MKSTIISLSTIVFTLATSASAQNATSVISITPACPTGPPADVMVTRSAAVVPSCAAGNGTKPTMVSMSGSGGMVGTATNSAGLPYYTGAAGRVTIDSLAAIAIGFGVAGLAL